MFSKILIANRGEIAVRIIKTCRRLGIGAVAVFSDADAESLAVEMADESVFIGPSPASQSYLRGEAIIEAALRSGAQAIHPGFGFLSERAEFARACAAAGVVFIGPNPAAIEAMGDKIASKRCAAAAGVSIVSGHVGEIADLAHAVKIAEEIGFPVMIKASAGGGGKGIRVARDARQVEEGLPAVRAEALGAFGDDRLFIEKFIENPRHIEIQVIGDQHGQVLHLFERECSIQRRNQKVIEEAPSPLIDPATREAMAAQAVALAKAVDYDSAGTVEFVASQDKSFYFLEMNTRLQVEHPVTELITGLDIVEMMIRSAAGERLGLGQQDVTISGWAIESRIYAEDPYRGFLPSIGRLVRYQAPAEGEEAGAIVRNDTGVREGDEISIFYDPMIAKLSTWAPDRAGAAEAMARSLEDFDIQGVGHNAPFLSAVIDQARFRSGELSTDYIPDEFPDGFHGLEPTPWQLDLFTAVAAFIHRLLSARAAEPAASGTRLVRDEWMVILGAQTRPIRIAGGQDGLTLELPEENRTIELGAVRWRPGEALFRGRLGGRDFTATVGFAAEGVRIRHRAASQRVLVLTAASAELHRRLPPKAPADTSRLVVCPMPGLVVSVDVAEGQEVRQGQALCIVEAMKMQNIIRAERDGVIAKLTAIAGDSVAADDILAEFA